MTIRTNYILSEFYDLLKSKMNENNSNKPTYWGLGSVAKAIFQTISYFASFIQLQINIMYNCFSVSTATNMHLVRRMRDWGLVKKQDVYAVTQLTFTGATTGRTSNIVIVAGTVIQSQVDYFGNTRNYIVADNTILITSNSSVKVLVVCSTIGSIGNTAANTINTLLNPINGIESVTNLEAVTNGAEKESDVSYRSRLPLYINGLKCGNGDAILNAAYGVSGITYASIEKNVPTAGTYTLFVTTADGLYDSIIYDLVKSAIEKVSDWCVTPLIIFPTEELLTIELNVEYDAERYLSSNLVDVTKLQIFNKINFNKKNIVYISDIIQLVKEIQGVLNVNSVKLNSLTQDIKLDKVFVLKIADLNQITVNVI